jgi:metal-responsive CopG/Arc/MetJ family transcriptional regulator
MARPATGQTPPISFRPPKQLLVEFDETIEEGRTRSDVLIELMHDRVTRKRRERPAPERPVSSEETSV